jgi:hypothetical protein
MLTTYILAYLRKGCHKEQEYMGRQGKQKQWYYREMLEHSFLEKVIF